MCAAVQPYRADVLKPRDLAHDFCVNYNVGGWRSGTPLPGDEWASNIVTHLRARRRADGVREIKWKRIKEN